MGWKNNSGCVLYVVFKAYAKGYVVMRDESLAELHS